MNEVTTPITSQDVLSLKQSCQIIIQAYKQYCGTQVKNDETALYPLITDQIIGLKGDANSGIDSLNSYSNLDLNKIERPDTSVTNLNSYSDLDNIQGNYTISQSIYDEAQADLKPVFNGLKDREVLTEEAIGSNFSDGENMTPSSGKTIVEKINEKGKNELPRHKNKTYIANNGQTKTYSNNKKGKYRNVISEDCIPCALRLGDLNDIEASLKLTNPLTEMVERYNQLVNTINHLFSNTDVENDLCNLLDFLGAQCIPDLVAIIALLNAMIMKDLGISLNLEGAFMMFIGPFFTPLLSGLNSVLDQYMQAIMQPIDCVLNALDTQLAKIDIDKAIDKMEVQNVIEHRRREAAMRRELEQLKEREAYLLEVKQERGGDVPPPRVLGGIRLETNPETGEKQRNGVDVSHLMNMGGARYLTIDQELRKLKSDIQKLSKEYKSEYGEKGEHNISNMIKKSQDPYKSLARELSSIPGNARNSLQEFRTTFAGGLQELRVKILNGKRMVNDTLDMISEEIMKLILGRASTSEGAINGLYEIQKTIRLIALIRTLIQLAEKQKTCKNKGSGNTSGETSEILSNYIRKKSKNDTGNDLMGNSNNFYEGNDGKGNSFLMVTPSDASLEIYDANSENTSDGTAGTGESIKQLSDIDEINKLNSQGIAKDIGNIANKKIMAYIPDLGIRVPVQASPIKKCNRAGVSTTAAVKKVEESAF